MFVDRFMSTAMHYPCNYGYIPHTLSDDGDPCDVLVLSPVPLITGVVVRCRPIGMLKMDDEAGGDTKILAVPIDKLSSLYRDRAVAARPARDHDAADRALLRALQGPRARQVGARRRAGSAPRKRSARSSSRSSATGQRRRSPSSDRARRAGRRAGEGARARMNDARTAALAPSLFVLLWSTGFIAAKYGLPYAPPLTFLLYRFVLVAALMAVVCVVTGARWPSQRVEYLNVAIAAWLVHGLYLGGVFVALSKGTARRHGGDAGRAAADPHRVPRPRVARRAGDPSAMGGPGAGTRRRLAGRAPQGFARRRPDRARGDRRRARGHQRRDAVAEAPRVARRPAHAAR